MHFVPLDNNLIGAMLHLIPELTIIIIIIISFWAYGENPLFHIVRAAKIGKIIKVIIIIIVFM